MLEQITCPADLRRLSYDDLSLLSHEIRNFIVEAVKENGGHLGSNLGVVELTIALHRVFDSPRDIMLWDTGHQAYVHKILTGRKKDFKTLRKEGGLSGYPSQSESEHDWIENSHASTALSYAFGIATAQSSVKGEGRRVIAVIGDGALTGGMAFEGLNNLGHSGSNAIIVLNDNGRSYAPTVSLLSDRLKKLRNNPKYLEQQEKLEKKVKSMLPFGESVERAIDAAKAAVREIWDPTSFFEDLGLRYNGPFDGHNIETLERAFRNAAGFEGPTVIHVLTEKGRGYGPAENDPIKRLHDIGTPKPGSYTAAFTEILIKEAESRPELVALTAAMPDSTGLLQFSERFPERFFDVGIAEQHAMTFAAGAACDGLKPVVAIYSTFLQRAYDQLIHDVSVQGLDVTLAIDRAGIVGADGPTHQGAYDLTFLRCLPDMVIMAPANEAECRNMLYTAYRHPGPAAVRYPRGSGPGTAETHDMTELPLGEAQLLRGGRRVAILAFGAVVNASLKVAETLDATLVNMRFVKPLDRAMILQMAAGHDMLVTVEENNVLGGAGSGVAEVLNSEGCSVAMVNLGLPDEHIDQGTPNEVLAACGLDVDGIRQSIENAIAQRLAPILESA